MADNYTGQPIINASGNTVGEGIIKVTGSIVGTNVVGSVAITDADWTGVGSVFIAGGSANNTVAGSVAVTNTVDVNVLNESNLTDRGTFFSGGDVAAGGSVTSYLEVTSAGSLVLKGFDHTASVPTKAVIGWSGVVSTSGQGNFINVGFAQNDNYGKISFDQDYILPSGTGSVMEANIFNRSLTVAADVYGRWDAGERE